MDKYNQYIDRLKHKRSEVDYKLMYTKISDKIHVQPIKLAARLGVALASATLLLVLSVAVLSSSPSTEVADNNIMGYVFTSNVAEENLVLDYIFMD